MSSSEYPVPWMIRICLMNVLFPDSPVPDWNRRRERRRKRRRKRGRRERRKRSKMVERGDGTGI